MRRVARLYKLAFVIPRYNCNAAGGAEKYCQELATHLCQRGHQVTILTTKAVDHYTWENHYKKNKEIVDGVTVRRFKTNYRDFRRFLINQVWIESHIELPPITETEWIKDSVNSTEMEQYIKKNQKKFDFFIFIPYLFGLIYNCSKIIPEKSFLIPCLHDEPYAYLSIFKEMFHRVKGLIFNAYPEMDLAKRIYALPDTTSNFVGVGVEKDTTYIDTTAFKEKYNITFPYIIFVGRKEEGKNFHLLLDYFNTYKKQSDTNLKLLVIGSGDYPWKADEKKHIIDLGYVSEEDKMNAIAGSLFLCQPSLNESFSIVIMEAWLVKRPVLVHHNCEVTKDHCLRSNGGLYFKNYPEFEECLNFFKRNKEDTNKLAENGYNYVKKYFNWNTVSNRFENALKKNLPRTNTSFPQTN